MTSTQQQIRDELDLDHSADDEAVLAAIRKLKNPEPPTSAWSFPEPPPPIQF